MSIQDEEIVNSDTDTVINLCQTPTTRPMTLSPSAELIFTAISSQLNTPKKYNSKKRPSFQCSDAPEIC